MSIADAGLDAFDLSQLDGSSYLEAAGQEAGGEIHGEAGEVDMVSDSGEVKLADDFAYYEVYLDYMQLPCLEGNSYENIDVLFDGEAVQDGVNIGDLWSFDDMPMAHTVYGGTAA